jgi:hypothetical protein
MTLDTMDHPVTGSNIAGESTTQERMTTSLDFTSPRSSLNIATKHVERRIKAGRGNTGPAALQSELLWLHSTSVIVHEADVQPRQTILAKVARDAAGCRGPG